MTYTERMLELNPVLGSILGQCETHIQNMIGSEVKLLIEEPKKYEDDNTPIWGWLNTEHKNRRFYKVERKDLDRLLVVVSKNWDVPPCYVKIPQRKREIVTMKQVFAMLVRQKYPTLSLYDIGHFLGRPDHSTAINWINQGIKFLNTQDPYFMAYYSPVKYLFDADNNS